MGYYVTIIESDIFLEKKYFDEVYKKMCELNDYDELKRGGSFPEKSDNSDTKWNPTKWFSWMPYNYPDEFSDMLSILHAIGFETRQDKDGNLVEISYYDKTGNEDYFLNCFAEFIQDGSFITWKGEEDEDYYRFVFLDKKMIKEIGKVKIDWVFSETYEFGELSQSDRSLKDFVTSLRKTNSNV